MPYGASVNRVTARGSGSLADIDIYKVAMLCDCERGLADVQREIYNMDDFYKKCGGFDSSKYGAYVARALFNTKYKNLNLELRVKMFVADDAVQAADEIMDGATTPVKIFDIKAGKKNKDDESAFGNKIAYKITQTENIRMKLTAASTTSTAVLNSVDNLEIGYYVKLDDGTNTDVVVITAIDRAAKQITFATITNTYTVADTTVTRIDWNLYIAVKDSSGTYSVKENKWTDMPFAQSDSLGMPLAVNDEDTGSDYVILAVNASNTSDPADQIPAEVTTWTELSGGSDGTAATDSDWNTAADALADEDVMIFLAPESSSIDHNANMADFATDNNNFIYYGQAANEADQEDLENVGANLRQSVTYSMIPLDKWFETDDPVTGGKISIPPVGHAAAFWFNTYADEGESKVAAGNKTTLPTSDKLLDSNGLVHNDKSSIGQRMIEKYSINLARYRKGKGITINSARTFSTDKGYMYQNQIMQTLLYQKSILAYMETIEQDKSGIDPMENHYNVVYAYMYKKWENGHLFKGKRSDGTKTEFEDSCILVDDFSINTLTAIANGEERTFMQFVAPPPIEKPILDIASAAVTTIRV